MATIVDVAQHAGVAVSTVSYVLSGKRPISDATRSRVLDAIAALDYRPTPGAHPPRRTVGLAVSVHGGEHRPLLAEFMLAASVAARGHRCNVLLLTDHQGSDDLLDAVQAARLDGLVMMDIGVADPRLDVVRRLSVPAVLIGLPANPAGLPCVDLDFEAAGRMCVDHLTGLGHRDIVFVGEPAAVYRHRAGYAERTAAGAFAQAAARGARLTHRPCEADWAGTAGTVARVLAERPDATALVVQNESATAHLPALLRSHGRAVPEDLSMVVIGSDAVATAGEPQLTSIAVPAAEMAARAVDLLMDNLDRSTTGTPVLLEPRLAVRASTRPAPVRGDEPKEDR
ncbi:LacI family DNA-binding transcriptional regulator [Streptomyces sp. FIT100]|uniref:LacI family DNA-binding transcriptional regulator n=1 Tax=Streptomyces sp. FIT100 TaxID=2837956 RepID=UPI0021C74E3D|nr:LacI family DNA-binding transcriptional regulator [Streptomyces sp. FIT100]UUN25485.1 LacI family transcriptional regulator [Streptomyces sp. FIT100]